jgi:hypothetical protein
LLAWLVILSPWAALMLIILRDTRRGDGYDWSAMSTVAIAFATVAGVAVASLQWTALHSTDEKIGRQLSLIEADQRAWVFVLSADPVRDLIFANDRAYAAVKFQLRNAGRTPARFASIEGEFVSRGQTADEVRKGWGTCNKARLKPEGQLLAGTAVFPGQEIPQATVFVMQPEDVRRWKADYDRATAEKTNFGSAAVIVGCVDYVFEKTNQHHQTRFVYEVDRKGPDAVSFLAIDPAAGNVPVGSIALAKNPGLADDPD